MDVDWHWSNKKKFLLKEGIIYELWRIWWSICTTRIKREVK